MTIRDSGRASKIKRRESAIGTGVCADCGQDCDLDKGLCFACRVPRTGRAVEVANPYKAVWNSLESEEASVMNAVRNGTLFVPTYAILAERSRSTARYLRTLARESGRVVGCAASKEADFHDRQAASMDAAAKQVNQLRQPRDFGFTVKKDNELEN